MITDIEDYFAKGCGRCARFETPDCSVRHWAEGVESLRRICLDAGLGEHVKWGHPCYVAHGSNIAVIGAFRDSFRLSFFNAALMTDPAGVLEKQGPNTQTPDMIRFADLAGPKALEPTITAYLKEAASYAQQGLKPPKPDTALDLPEELIEALDTDPELAEAFHTLTPGRRKSYVINLNSAKKPGTRIARIHKFRDKIIAGKGALER